MLLSATAPPRRAKMDGSTLLSAASAALAYATPGAALAALAALALGTTLRVLTSDADLATLAALRRYPRAGAWAGQVVLITGASSGIGEAMALRFARGGATLVLAARRLPQLQAVAAACVAAGAAGATALQLDVLDAPAAHEAAVAAVLAAHGRIDVLCNNAGRSQRGLVERTPAAVDVELFALNVHGTISVTKAVLRRALAARAPLRILNTSSVAGKVGAPCSATYAATKHALNGYMDSLRMEVAARGVSITNACPGPVESEITLHAFTETAGAKAGLASEAGAAPRMPAARAAELMLAAAHAKLPESWLAPQPILAFVYVSTYFRGAYFALGARLGAARVAAFEKGQSGYGFATLSNALGGGAKKGD